MPDTTQTTSSYYLGEAGARYMARHQSDPFHIGYRLNFEYFRPYLKAGDRVLDFGCGNGGMLRLLAKHLRSAEGLEVNPLAADLARGSGCVVHSGLEALPGGPSYDAIVSNHVLEHVRDAASALERLRGSMKKGGLLLLKLPINDWRSREEQHWSKEDPNHHLQTWTPKLMGNLLYEAGYEVEQIRIVTSAWHPRLFPLVKLGLGGPAFWAFAVWKNRRQLFVIARVPA